MSFGQQRLEQAQERIDGNTATVTIPNAKVRHMVRVGKVWKVDDSAEGAAEENGEQKAHMFDSMAGLANRLAEEVKQGRFQNASEVRAALQKNIMTAMKQ
jgi:hypothetical protein